MVLVILGLLGLMMGSFVSALVWRLKQNSRKKGKKYSMWHGRSVCPQCKHTLAWYDLLPVVSWLSLKGRCRYCRKPIADSPLVEIGMAILFIISYWAWPKPLTGLALYDFIFWLAVSVFLVALLVYDLKWMLLPNKIVYPLTIFALLWLIPRVLFQEVSIGDLGLSLAAGASVWGVFYGLFQISRGQWIGGGDVKLGFLLGLILDRPLKALSMIFIASLLGSIVAVPLMISGKAKTSSRVPFGPFLILGTIIVRLWGESLLDWYLHDLLLL